jgi:heme oxygenase
VSAADSPLRQQLRQATAAAHTRLENALDLLQMPLSPARLCGVLQRFHGFHRGWEPALEARLGSSSFVRSRQKVRLLHDDLMGLGLSAAEVDALPVCSEAARLCDQPASAWGSLYVIEGSTLGGKFITRALTEAGWPARHSLRYFDPYGALTGQRWQATLEGLATLPPALADEVVDGALRCFGVLQAWLVPKIDMFPSDAATDGVAADRLQEGA